ncbi:chaperonin 10-like protein [Mycena filopes]|nr:chaperonin 10-like protein [Mycena filopes]
MSQKSLLYPSKQAAFVLAEQPIPIPGPGELLVSVRAAALNPADSQMQAYGILVEDFPTVLGFDAAGIVEQVGEGVTAFVKGDRVLYPCIYPGSLTSGGFQQYAIARAKFVAKVPSNVSLDEAASIPATFSTAALPLYDDVKVAKFWDVDFKPANKPILIFAGATSVGQFVIQFAKLSGFSPIITTASLHNTELLKGYGATHVIDRRAFSPEAVAKITASPISLIYDAIWTPATRKAGLDLLAPDGVLLTVQPGEHGDKRIIGVYGTVYAPRHDATGQELYTHLSQWLADGVIQPNRVEVLPGGLNGVKVGCERLQNDLVSGVKLVVRPHETVEI